MRAWLSWAGLASATLLVSAGACGQQTSNGFGNQTDDGGGGSSGGGSSGGGDDAPAFGGDSSGGPTCDTHCSSDLHTVIDCNNHVVTTCPPDKGCGPGGTCVAACQSADANKSTIGCDYYSVDPGTDGEANGSCFAAYIANTWGSAVSIKIDYAGQSVDAAPYAFIPSGQGASITYMPLPSGQLPTGQLAIVFLADATAVTNPVLPTHCPAGTQAFYTTAEASSEFTNVVHAFRLTTSAPVVAYDIFPYGGSLSYISSATLLIPTSAWDTNYLAIDTFAKSQVAGPTAQPFTEIVASADATHVTISPTAAIVGGTGVAATGKGVPVTYTLNHGDVVQLKQDAELNGSPIQADKPIGVWGGNTCQNIDVSDTACDSGHQQLPPVKALGHEYVAARYRDRQANNEEDPPWRIMGAVDGTTLTYEPGTPNGAPTVLNSGQVGMFYAAGPFVVRSQDAKHPFYVSGHMGGQNFHGGDYGTGDPESVNVIPPEQYLASYVFMTDPTMANTNLVLVRGKAQDGTFKDVTLDCAGVVSGWLPAGNGGNYEFARVDLVVGGAPSGSCNNGRHEIHSDAAFGLTVWGWDTYVSYAYPSGASVQPINTVVVPPNPK
jgi:hypothetical protein